MSQMDHVWLLEQLIISAELCLQMRSLRPPHVTADLLKRIEEEARKPAVDKRVIDTDTLIFAMALSSATSALNSHERDRAARYLRLVGVLLPEIRDALGVAMEQRRRPTP